MSPLEIGDQIEERFFHALSHDQGAKPPWFVRVERASPTLDARGIDGFALIRHPSRDEAIRIPIQIKASKRLFDLYYQQHPWAKKAGVILVAVNTFQSDDEICWRFYQALRQTRVRRIPDEKILHTVESRETDAGEIAIRQKIEAKRHAAQQPEPRSFWRNLWNRLQNVLR